MNNVLEGRALTLHVLCIVAVLTACQGEGTGPPTPTSVAEFEQRLENLRSSAHIPAITAVISAGQDIVWVKGFGIADLSTQRPAADTTVYHLASLTKPLASTVILQLVDEGKVSLDDPGRVRGRGRPRGRLDRHGQRRRDDPDERRRHHGGAVPRTARAAARAPGHRDR